MKAGAATKKGVFGDTRTAGDREHRGVADGSSTNSGRGAWGDIRLFFLSQRKEQVETRMPVPLRSSPGSSRSLTASIAQPSITMPKGFTPSPPKSMPSSPQQHTQTSPQYGFSSATLGPASLPPATPMGPVTILPMQQPHSPMATYMATPLMTPVYLLM